MMIVLTCSVLWIHGTRNLEPQPNTITERIVLIGLYIAFIDTRVACYVRQVRPCSVSSQSMWIERDWMGLNPK
jgi:hypothetical protein